MSHAKGGVDAPNFTQCPNAIFEAMPSMSNSELRVVLAITRQTEGWHKESDELTVEQLMELTGLSNRAVIDGVQQGMKRGIIKRKEKVKGAPRKGFMYSLVVNRSHKKNTSVVNEVHSDSERGSQPLVNEVHTQNKEKQTKQNKKDFTDEGANAAPSPAAAQSPVLPIEKAQPDPVTANAVTTSPPIAPPPPKTGKRKKSDGATAPKEPKPESVDMYQRWVRREYNPPTFCTRAQVELITNTVTDLPRWERTLSYWAKNAYRPNRVEDLLDAYSKDSGVIDQARRDNFTRAAPKPQPGTEYEKAQKQPRLSQEEIQRRIQMAEEAERNLQ